MQQTPGVFTTSDTFAAPFDAVLRRRQQALYALSQVQSPAVIGALNAALGGIAVEDLCIALVSDISIAPPSLEWLQEHLSAEQGILRQQFNELQVAHIVLPLLQALNQNRQTMPSIEQLWTANRQLSISANQGNPLASAWQEITLAQITLHALSQTTELQSALEYIEALSHSAQPGTIQQPGNGGFAGLISVITSDLPGDLRINSNAPLWYWQSNLPGHPNHNFPIFPANFPGLSGGDANEARLQACQNLAEIVTAARVSDPLVMLSREQVFALALATHNCNCPDANNTALRDQIFQLFHSIANDSRPEAQQARHALVLGLLDAALAGTNGIADLLLELRNCPEFETNLGPIAEEAAHGNPTCLQVLAGLASIGCHGPGEWGVDSIGHPTGQPAGGANHAQWTASQLLHAANAIGPTPVIDACMQSLSVRNDQFYLLETLAMLQSSAPERPEVYDLLMQGYLSSLPVNAEMSPAQQSRHQLSAARAILTDQRALTPAVIDQLVSNMSPALSQAISETHLPAHIAQSFLAAIRTRCESETVIPISQRISLTAAIASLHQYASNSDVNTLVSLMPQPPGQHGPLSQPEQQLYSAISHAMTTIMVGAKDGQARHEALECLLQHGWAPGMTTEIRQAATNYIHDRPYDVVHVEGLYNLVYGINSPPPLAVTLSRWGIDGSPEELQELASSLAQRATFTQIMSILSMAALYNHAAPEARVHMFGGTGGPAYIDITDLARELAAGEIPPGVEWISCILESQSHHMANMQQQRQALLAQIQQLSLHIQQTPATIRQSMYDAAELERTVPADTSLDGGQGYNARRDTANAQSGILAGYQADVEQLHQLSNQLVVLDAHIRNAHSTVLLYNHQMLSAAGQTLQADALLMSANANGLLPPSLHQALNDAWHRAHNHGLVPFAERPTFSSNPQTAAGQALSLLPQLHYLESHHPAIGNSSALLELNRIAVDSSIAQCMQTLRSHPSVSEMHQLSNEFSRLSQNLVQFYHAAADFPNHRSNTLVSAIRDQCQALQTQLNNPHTHAVVANLQSHITQLQQTASHMPAGPARQQLESHIYTLQFMVQSFSGSPLRNHINNILTAVNRGDVNNPTTWQSIRNELIIVGAVAVACTAAALATAPIGGAGGFALGLLLFPAVSMTAQHGAQQLLFAAGLAPQGSPIYHALCYGHVNAATGDFQYMSAEHAAAELWNQYREEFVSNAVATGFGHLGSSVGGMMAHRPPIPFNAATQQRFLAHAGQEFLWQLGPSLATTAPGFAVGGHSPDHNISQQALGQLVAFATGHMRALHSPHHNNGQSSPVNDAPRPAQPIDFVPVQHQPVPDIGLNPIEYSRRPSLELNHFQDGPTPGISLIPVEQMPVPHIDLLPTPAQASVPVESIHSHPNGGQTTPNIDLIPASTPNIVLVPQPPAHIDLHPTVPSPIDVVPIQPGQSAPPPVQTHQPPPAQAHQAPSPQPPDSAAIQPPTAESHQPPPAQTHQASSLRPPDSAPIQPPAAESHQPAQTHQAPAVEPSIRHSERQLSEAEVRLLLDRLSAHPDVELFGQALRTGIVDAQALEQLSSLTGLQRQAMRDMLLYLLRQNTALGSIPFPASSEPIVLETSAPNGREVSRQARFSHQNGQIVVEDVGSTSGTWIVGQDGSVRRINGTHVLQPGETVLLGLFGPRVELINGHIALLPPVLQPSQRSNLAALAIPDGGHITVGQDAGFGSNLRYFDGVSNQHASFSYHDGQLVVEDLGSVAGTWIRKPNGTIERITGSHVLQPGESVLLGVLGPRIEFSNGQLELRQPISSLPLSDGAPTPAQLGSMQISAPTHLDVSTNRSYRTVRLEVGDRVVDLRCAGGFLHTQASADFSNIKLHINVVSAADLVRVQEVLISHLLNDPVLRECLAGWKTMDPYFATGQNGLAYGALPTGIGQGAKGFTLYLRNAADAAVVQARLAEILARHNLSLPHAPHTGNFESPDPLSHRIGITRDYWLTFDGNNFVLDTSLSRAIGDHFSLQGRQTLSEVQLRQIEQELGLAPNTLNYVSFMGRPMLALQRTPTSKKDNPNFHPVNGSLLYATEVGSYTGRGLINRPALMQLYHRFGTSILAGQ